MSNILTTSIVLPTYVSDFGRENSTVITGRKRFFKRSKQSFTYQIGAKIAKTASNIQRKLIEIVTSESTTTTTQFIGSDTDDTELDEESFTSIISNIDEEPGASKPVLASTSASFKTPTKRSARLAKQSK